ERLKYGRRLVRHLASADRRCHVIAGINQNTVCGLSSTHDGFVFKYSLDGDGTVPLSSAQWSGAQHWYVREMHGQLPRNEQVCQAVVQLLRDENTTLLSNQHSPTHSTTAEINEQDLRAVLNGKVRWDQLPPNERRDLLEPVIS